MTENPVNPLREQKVTIDDVAMLAGVSISTVSRVLNTSGYVSKKTADKVNDAIRKLKFVPQSSARNLASNRTNTLGLVVHELAAPFILPLLRGIENATRDSGLNLLVGATMDKRRLMATLGEHNADGLLVTAGCITDEELLRLYYAKFPIVLMFRKPPDGFDIPYIVAENRQSSSAMVSHLIKDCGRRRIAFLRGLEADYDSHQRELGYRDALAEHGIPFDESLVGYGGFDEAVARNTIETWLEKDLAFDAVFAGDDEAAVGVYHAAESAGLSIPDDIMVVGFDDDYLARRMIPSLTTVHVPIEEIGKNATCMLIDLINGKYVESMTLPTEVVIRRSSCIS
ncbi:MAG: LacI family DNA-binding transcriptional regulator [Aggregatilineales bacterium]